MINSWTLYTRLPPTPWSTQHLLLRGNDTSLILLLLGLSEACCLSAASPTIIRTPSVCAPPLFLPIYPLRSLSDSHCPLWKPLSPLALPLSSPFVRILQAALLPLCLSHVLPLEDTHLGSCCTLLCVLINILAASGRKWVFLSANPLYSGCFEERKGKMIEEGQPRLFLFSMSELVRTCYRNQMPWKIVHAK